MWGIFFGVCFGSQEPGVRSQEPGARSQESGARSRESESRSQEPGVVSSQELGSGVGVGGLEFVLGLGVGGTRRDGVRVRGQ